jgi:hypothetical protein
MRVHWGVLLCRCLPLGVVATVWAAAHVSARRPEVLDDRWYVTPDGEMIPLGNAAPQASPEPSGVAVAARP